MVYFNIWTNNGDNMRTHTQYQVRIYIEKNCIRGEYQYLWRYNMAYQEKTQTYNEIIKANAWEHLCGARRKL